MESEIADYLSTRLEALLDADANAAHGGARLAADIQQALHGLAVGKKVVQNQHLVSRGEELLGKGDIVITAVGIRMYGGSVNIAVDVLALGLLGKITGTLKCRAVMQAMAMPDASMVRILLMGHQRTGA